jgi:hypothetical protein
VADSIYFSLTALKIFLKAEQINNSLTKNRYPYFIKLKEIIMKKFICFLAIVAFTACVSDKNMDNKMQTGDAEQSGMMSEQSGMPNVNMSDEGMSGTSMPDASMPEKGGMRGSIDNMDDNKSMPRSMTDEM